MEKFPMPIISGKNDSHFRQQLADITRPADAPGLKEQIQKIAKLSVTNSHSITLVQENIPGTPVFNCYQYSFGLASLRFRIGILQVFPGRDFTDSLINTHLDEIGPNDAEDGDHIVYSNAQTEHAGFIRAGAIDSKWGTGHIWRHGVYELPAYYGDTVRFFRHIPQEDAVKAFLDLNPNMRIEE
jgi:hypothetical protein